MKIYNYHPLTKVFIGISDADPNPMREGDYLIPADATTVQPPSFGQGQQAYWNGSAWGIQNIPSPEPEPEPVPLPLTWDNIRAERNYKLLETDWVFTPDSPVQDTQSWITYRQALRDVPQTFSTPESVVWPQRP